MKKSLTICTVIACLLAFSCATHRQAQLADKKLDPDLIAKAIDELTAQTDPNVNMGVHIQSLSSGKVIYEKNAGRHFIPASTIKLLGLAAALHYLGPSYRFVTRVYTDQVLGEGVVNNLYLKGSGDPSLTAHDLLNLAQEIHARGIKTIKGKIYADAEIFDGERWVRGAMWDDRDRGYSAPVRGINLNYNRLLLKVVPSTHKGGLARVVLQPRTSYVQVQSKANTKDRGVKDLSYVVEKNRDHQKSEQNADKDGLWQGDKIIIDGQMPTNAEPHYISLAINEPAYWAAHLLKEQLQHMSVSIKGDIALGPTPDKVVVLAAHESRSLAEALVDWTKISNNIAHDALVKAIAAAQGMKPASFDGGLKLIAKFLQEEVGINAKDLINADGSGVSRYNLITPGQMAQVINYAANHFHMGPEFLTALSFGGEDGLLKRRLQQEGIRGNIRAKSGSLSGIANLAGIINYKNKERLSVVIMINGFIGSGAPYISLHDKIIGTLLDVATNPAPTARVLSKMP